MNYKEISENFESNVRSYCRVFDSELVTAKNASIVDSNGKKYIDFFCGAGAVNYGHNNDFIKQKILNYIQNDGIMHALDMYTKPKTEFIDFFENKILRPRELNYKIQFTNPTGTNSVEAALKLARKIKQRINIWCLMGCFHGMTLGALACTTDKDSRAGAGVPLNNVTHIPAPYMFKKLDTIMYMQTLLDDDHSGIEKPAAIIIETVQAEGGVYVLDNKYLKSLEFFCKKNDILLIIDEVQIGNARTGTYFSFERAKIKPDIICLSKSIGGYGFPFALTLIKPELDIWKPGEHNGTFRGNQLAIVAAKAGCEYMLKNNIEKEVLRKGKLVKQFLTNEINSINKSFEIRGIGLIWGIDTHDSKKAIAISKKCYINGLIIERAGRDNTVIKLMPPLTITDSELMAGLSILKYCIGEIYK